MGTTVEEKREERSSRRFATGNNGAWARGCATVGAAAWAVLAVAAHFGVARIGGIELLFLFAPLVIVPLGMELWRLTSPPPAQDAREKRGTRVFFIARRVQPFLALLAVGALLLPPGPVAAMLAAGWLLVCLLMGAAGAMRIG